MKLILRANGFDLKPENKMEADMLEIWDLGGSPRIGLTTSDMWQHFEMRQYFDVVAGSKKKQELARYAAGLPVESDPPEPTTEQRLAALEEQVAMLRGFLNI